MKRRSITTKRECIKIFLFFDSIYRSSIFRFGYNSARPISSAYAQRKRCLSPDDF